MVGGGAEGLLFQCGLALVENDRGVGFFKEEKTKDGVEGADDGQYPEDPPPT